MESGSFADRYQTVLVPVIFEPWARESIRRAKPKAGEQILDLACGTGVVSRQLAGIPQSQLSIIGVDHSDQMLGVARSVAKKEGLEIEWIEADAADLPFSDGIFDLAFCQQALQFFPDRAAALQELHRVLKPGGRAVFCVQRELAVNPMLRAQAAAFDSISGGLAGEAVRAICGLSNAEEIRNLFEGAGFSEVQIESVTLSLYHPNARAFAEGAMGGMHTGDKLAGLATTSVRDLVDLFLHELGDCLEGDAMRFPHTSHVVMATANAKPSA